MTLPGETAAGNAGVQPYRGISGWLSKTRMVGAGGTFHALSKSTSDRKTSCLENPQVPVYSLSENVPVHFTLNRRRPDPIIALHHDQLSTPFRKYSLVFLDCFFKG